MSFAILPLIWRCRVGSPTDKIVLLRCADFARDDGSKIFGSVGRIARETELDERSVQRALGRLRASGVLVLVSEQPGRSREYRIDLDQVRALTSGTVPPPAEGHHRQNVTLPPVTESPPPPARRRPPPGPESPNPSYNPQIDPSFDPLDSPRVIVGVVNDVLDESDEAIRRWNALSREIGIPAVNLLSDAHRRKLRLRLKELGGLAGWDQLLDKIRFSPFLSGQEKDWRVVFTWVLVPANVKKIMDGNYDRSSHRNRRATHADTIESLARVGGFTAPGNFEPTAGVAASPTAQLMND